MIDVDSFGIEVVPIEGFWDYYITINGDVVNAKTWRKMTTSPTAFGEPTVGLVRDGRQYRRSVKVLVARAFVEGETEIFDTPIQLDGNRNNLRADNIVWRPRWFAWKYSNQFQGGPDNYPDWYYGGPVLDVVNGIRYDTVLEAAIENGILCRDILSSCNNQTQVFPTAQLFTFC